MSNMVSWEWRAWLGGGPKFITGMWTLGYMPIALRLFFIRNFPVLQGQWKAGPTVSPKELDLFCWTYAH